MIVTRISDKHFRKIEESVYTKLSETDEITTQDICAMEGEKVDPVRYVLGVMTRYGKIARHREGRAIWYTLPEETRKSMHKKDIFNAVLDLCSESGEPVTVPQIIAATGADKERTYFTLSTLCRTGKVVKVNVNGEYAYLPNHPAYAKGYNVVPFYIETGNVALPFISRFEVAAARERLKIGDVMKAVYLPGEESFFVVVKEKSRHLFICTDGNTFSYADLAKYYRYNGKRPLGLWL